ncbi:hypothetical protein ACHAWO_009991 [Cyclotella atomus]|uniref:Uncharacterized protein n=1 Tax=Cyclotella atomus TaxID=382360 RepID=A0ABD3QHR8_9STRA
MSNYIFRSCTACSGDDAAQATAFNINEDVESQCNENGNTIQLTEKRLTIFNSNCNNCQGDRNIWGGPSTCPLFRYCRFRAFYYYRMSKLSTTQIPRGQLHLHAAVPHQQQDNSALGWN